MKPRSVITGLFSVITVVVISVAGVVWACTPDAHVSSIEPRSGPAGTMVEVRGDSFNDGPVEIRWDGLAGPQIGQATAAGSEVHAVVRIPDAPPGMHYINVVQRDARGNVAGQGRAAFEVVPAVTGAQAPVVTAAPPGADPSGGSAARQAASAPGRSSLTPRAASPVSGQVTAPNAQVATDGASRPAAVDQAAALPRTSDDLWSGFQTGTGGSVTGPGLNRAPVSDEKDRGWALGVALVSIGLVSLLAGFGLSEVQRRRALS